MGFCGGDNDETAEERAERLQKVLDSMVAVGRPPLTHVAIRFRGQVWSLPRPFRHHDIIRVICWNVEGVEHFDAHDDDQGFLDEAGRYLTRGQAKVSAEINGQIKNGKTIAHVLTSEDLW